MQVQSTTGIRFKQVRQYLGWKQIEFAEQLEIDSKKISRIEKNVQLPDSQLLIRLGEDFGIRPDWLLQGHGSMQVSGIPGEATVDNELKEAVFHVDPKDYSFIPVYDVSASAGYGAFQDFASQEAVQHMAFLNSWIFGNLGSSSDRLVVIRAVGDSMIPTINNGDSLLIEVSPHFVGDGLYCVQLHDTLLAKRVQRQTENCYQLISENPCYQHQTITEEEEDSFRLVGRILWVGKQL